jgi:hypothetical protein
VARDENERRLFDADVYSSGSNGRHDGRVTVAGATW